MVCALHSATGIKDATLCDAIANAEKGVIDVNLVCGVIKPRIAWPNEGKASRLRSAVLFRLGDKAFFVYGFPKSARSNLRKDELKGFRELAAVMLGYDKAALAKASKTGTMVEITCHE